MVGTLLPGDMGGVCALGTEGEGRMVAQLADEWQQWGQLDPQVLLLPAMMWEESGVSSWRKGGQGSQGWSDFQGCPQSPVDLARFPQWAGMFSLSGNMFNFLSASTWVILKNKMLIEKSRLPKDKYNVPPLSYMFRIHETLGYIFMYAYTYICGKHFWKRG